MAHAPPLLGFGTYNKLKDHQAMANATLVAIKAGYRHIDCAQFYVNEDLIGKVIKEALAEGLVKREELYITSKFWNHEHAPEDVVACLEERLKLLQLDYLDLYLMHWPIAFKKSTYRLQSSASDTFFAEHDDSISIIDTWRAMEGLQKSGKVKAIGVSNFSVKQLAKLLEQAEIPPVTNQVECHPYYAQEEMLEFCKQHNIVLTAFCPLGKAGILSEGQPNILQDPVILDIAKKHGRTAAQVVLRWNTDREVRVIPKSLNKERIHENANILNFTLSNEDHAAIKQLNKGIRLNNPFWADFGEEITFKTTQS